MSMTKPVVALVGARPSDLALIDRWVAQPDIRRWWGTVTGSRRDVRFVMNNRRAGAWPFMIMQPALGPVGYVQVTDFARLKDPDGPTEIPENVCDIDILIASGTLRGRGIGTTAIKLARQTVLRLRGRDKTPPPFTAWILDRNQRSRRAFEKAGYRLYTAPDMGKYAPWIVMMCDGQDGEAGTG